MTGPDAVGATARLGADSVFRYVAAAAEAALGGVRWRTLNDAGEPQYRGDLYSNGGIPIFLADYYRLTGTARALDLGMRGAEWCAAPDREFLADRFTGGGAWSLLGGRAGPGLSWLRLAAVTHDDAPLERASAAGDALLERPPGPFTGLSMGAAGQGIFLLRLWERTGDTRHLLGAERRAAWLAARAVQTEGGCFWRVAEEGKQPGLTSICHGAAGVGYFFLLLHKAIGDGRYAELARAAAGMLTREARPDRGGLNWLPHVGATTDLDLSWKPVPVGRQITRCQWCNGAPGIGLFFAKAYEVLRDAAYLATAQAAGEATYAYGDGRGNPTYCHGLAGNAELLIELFRVTGSPRWLGRAHEFARRMVAYRSVGQEGDTWAADDPASSAPDLLCGAAGAGHVFLRLIDPHGVRMALL